jgi:seryl-tRNA synthetase
VPNIFLQHSEKIIKFVKNNKMRKTDDLENATHPNEVQELKRRIEELESNVEQNNRDIELLIVSLNNILNDKIQNPEHLAYIEKISEEIERINSDDEFDI